MTRRVVGIDVNSEYLEATQQRYSKLNGLELYSIDLAKANVNLEPVRLIHAALVFEHAGVTQALENALSFVAPDGHLSVVLQLPSESTENVSPSQFLAMEKLKAEFTLVDPE